MTEHLVKLIGIKISELKEDDLSRNCDFGRYFQDINNILYKIRDICEKRKESKIWKSFKRTYLHWLNRLEFVSRISTEIKTKALSVISYIDPMVKMKVPVHWRECQWIECKNKKKRKRLWICKGCKLVTYCCKSHQKKDWKFIHSTQCLKKLSLILSDTYC